MAIAMACGDALAQQTASTSADAPLTPDSAPQPLWEVGVLGGVGSYADYPAADHYAVAALAAPYFIYRGGLFRSDSSGPRVRAAAGNVEFQITGAGALSSQHSASRIGMPGLDYLLEIGPKARITLDRPTPSSRIFVDLPLRVVVSTNFDSRFDWRGLDSTPQIAYEDEKVLGSRWGGRIEVGAEFATARLQQYFYQVDPQYARPDRPAYQAHGGYLGSNVNVIAYRPLTPHFNLFLAAEFDYYGGAENQASPLAKSRTGVGGIIGFSWSIWQSKLLAESAR